MRKNKIRRYSASFYEETDEIVRDGQRVAPQVLYEVMTEGLFAAPAYKGYGKTMVEETYEPPGSPIYRRLEGRKPDSGRS